MRNTYALILKRRILHIVSTIRLEIEAPTRDIAILTIRNSYPQWKPIACALVKSSPIGENPTFLA